MFWKSMMDSKAQEAKKNNDWTFLAFEALGRAKLAWWEGFIYTDHSFKE